MMGYPLEELLRIRKIRVDEAEAEVTRLRHALQAAKSQLTQKEERLQEYTVWRAREEERRYQQIKKNYSPKGNWNNFARPYLF